MWMTVTQQQWTIGWVSHMAQEQWTIDWVTRVDDCDSGTMDNRLGQSGDTATMDNRPGQSGG